jgi:hypothetical protein
VIAEVTIKHNNLQKKLEQLEVRLHAVMKEDEIRAKPVA